LILFVESMAGVFSDTLDADVFIIGFAIKFERLVVEATELMVATDIFLLAGQLENYEVLAQ
jgi:hypothetical protein